MSDVAKNLMTDMCYIKPRTKSKTHTIICNCIKQRQNTLYTNVNKILKQLFLGYLNPSIINIVEMYLYSWILEDYLDDGVHDLHGCNNIDPRIGNKPANYINKIAVSDDISKIIIKGTEYDRIINNEVKKIHKLVLKREKEKEFTVKLICRYLVEMISELVLSCDRLRYDYKLRNNTIYIIMTKY